jgi:assimilatory nitrate reductase catalytic subunit
MGAVRTTCPYCGVGCGIKASVTGPRSAEIKGDEAHPANQGRLCSKGTHLAETINLQGRLLVPQVMGAPASWDMALDLVAQKFASTIADHGPDSVAFYVSGQLLTEDYYVANKLMKGFIGAANIDTNSRLCMASAVAAHMRSFGEDVVPASYDDLDEADVILLVGSNTAWCHPIIYQRIMRAKESRGTKIIVIDPRRTETADMADLHLALKPGSDVALFQALLAHLYLHGAVDETYLKHVDVPEAFWSDLIALGDPVAYAARACDLPEVALGQFFELFAQHDKTATLFSQGVNQSSRGTDKANAILNVHLATGRIGKPGATAFSLTGQPNAMGGREVGGLATQLAAHMDFAPENVARIARFWNSAAVAQAPGLRAVDLFKAVADGKIKALWIMATNPAVSMPEANAVRAALAACPFVVVSDCIRQTDTTDFAHVLLPSAAWGEKDGTVTNSDRTISRQRAFLPSPGEARADWWQLAQVAQRMGFEPAFSYENAASIFREHAALSAFENEGARLFNIGACAHMSDAEYEAMAPFVWGKARYFADGQFPTASGRARLVPVAHHMPAGKTTDDFPLVLNSARLRDQWHTMTRTGLANSLARHRREPFVEMSVADAATYGVADGDLARITTAHGADIFRVQTSSGQRAGEICVPIHWSNAGSSGGKAGVLVNAATDAVSGQPEFKHTPAALAKYAAEFYGLFIGAGEANCERLDYWTKSILPGATAVEFASNSTPQLLRQKLLPQGADITSLDMQDDARGQYRYIALQAGRCVGALYLSKSPLLLARSWLFDAFEADSGTGLALLAGRSAAAQDDQGEIVCACFNVGLHKITRTIAAQQLASVDEIGAALRAGTNCGSCRPMLAKLLRTGEMANAA